jgi:hypothetical protein
LSANSTQTGNVSKLGEQLFRDRSNLAR